MKRPDMLKEMENPKEQLNLMDSMLKLIGKR